MPVLPHFVWRTKLRAVTIEVYTIFRKPVNDFSPRHIEKQAGIMVS